MVREMLEIDQVDQLCNGCLAGKQKRLPFINRNRERAEHNLDLIHGDLCGLITPITPRGNRYVLLLVDDRSRYMWVRLLASKDQAASTFKQFKATVEVETGRKIKALRTDQGGRVYINRFQQLLC